MDSNFRERSRVIMDGPSRAPARSYFRAVGLTDEDMSKPLVGIANTWIEIMPCNSHLRHLAEKVKELTHSNSEIVFVPYDEAYEEGFEDMPRRVPDTSKINQLVGFKPEITLDGILETVINFHRGRPASFDE